MAFYEVTFVARPDLNNSEVEALAAEFAEIVSSQGGKIVKQEFWGLRKLAYLINKNSKGHYVFFGLDCDAPTLHELERKLRLNETVMRNLTIKVDAIEKDASAPIRQDDEKEYNVA